MDMFENLPANAVASLCLLPPYIDVVCHGQRVPLSYMEIVIGPSVISPTQNSEIGELCLHLLVSGVIPIQHA